MWRAPTFLSELVKADDDMLPYVGNLRFTMTQLAVRRCWELGYSDVREIVEKMWPDETDKVMALMERERKAQEDNQAPHASSGHPDD